MFRIMLQQLYAIFFKNDVGTAAYFTILSGCYKKLRKKNCSRLPKSKNFFL